MHFSLRSLQLALLLLVPGLLPAAENPLVHAREGQWAKYLVTRDVPATPFLSSKDRPRWRIIAQHNTTSGLIRVDNKIAIGGRPQNGGGSLVNSKEPYEPLFGLAKNGTITVVSSGDATLEVAGKPIACTKIVRKIVSPVTEINPGWTGTSTIWVSNDVPLGLVRMENDYDEQPAAGDKPQHITEKWVLAESGDEWTED